MQGKESHYSSHASIRPQSTREKTKSVFSLIPFYKTVAILVIRKKRETHRDNLVSTTRGRSFLAAEWRDCGDQLGSRAGMQSVLYKGRTFTRPDTLAKHATLGRPQE